MIVQIDRLLQEIADFDDTPDIANALRQMLPMSGGKQTTMEQAIANLEGMHALLRSARHHLAIKALDSA